MKLNNILALIILFIGMSFSASGADAVLDSANDAYAKANYEKAIKLYESILNKGEVAPEIYFNLGNAYYKSNSIGFAILNYERAKKLAPDDDDITANLKLANQKTEDKIESAPQMFLTTWKNGIVDMMSERSWSVLCIVLITLALGLFAMYLFTSLRTLKQIGFFGGSILILLAVVIFFIAKHKYEKTKNSATGIITTPSVTVTGSPTDKGTKLFILHEGSKVNIMENDGVWTEIKIANGNVGWIQTKNVSAI